ncbi:hypothetical protein Q4F19_16215 [Sphingomonas sp. BIUV-7]|uniref:Uncharacterized protein n=1 Tax=Sphingomonas natans TaxID=3063330 RepID=A0ABT8YC68_9SPHN|nr:hypothetical protein [Sphingomonas sp. BIUV-7]MDO6415936.1 hypothetical protein [Sphingomonas sp. BIUV-7]
MHIFQAETDTDILTIFAKTYDDAANLFCAWHLINYGDALERFSIARWAKTRIERYGLPLRRALAAGLSGVGVLEGDIWRIYGVDEAPMAFVLVGFATDDSDHQAAIFAESVERAEEIWDHVQHQLQHMPAGWLGSEWSEWQLLGHGRHQQAAESLRREGVGIYSPDTGWAILPIDYAAFDLDPPEDDPREHSARSVIRQA